jgi:hypothetical protein
MLMKLTLGSLVMTVMGVMLIGIIHNPNTMLIGLVLLIGSQTMMFTSGWRKGRRK